MKILVIQQKMIGDVLVSSLICDHLKDHFPNSEVHYVVNENTVAVVKNNPSIDRIVVFKPQYKHNKWAFFQFLRSISRERYDVVIDVYGKLESNLITIFSKAKQKISYKKGYSKLLYTDVVSLQPRQLGKSGITVEDRLGLLAPLLLSNLDKTKEPKIILTGEELRHAKLFLETHGIDRSRPVLMLGILGSSETKTYPLEQMAQVIEAIASQTNATLLFNYMPSQQPEALRLYTLCSKQVQSRIAFDIFAPSLRKFLALLYHCAAFIGNEGGAVNMAKALGIPTYSIYSPWITKMAWHTLDNDNNIAVHIGDYLPELIQKKSKKELRNNSTVLYETFRFDFFSDSLTRFLKNHAFVNK